MSHTLTLTEAGKCLQDGSCSSEELVSACLKRMDAIEDKVHAFVEVTAEQALQEARAADSLRASGKDLPLLGIPLALKDNIAVRGRGLTCASKILGRFVSPYDATVTRKLRDAGAVFLGRTNMDEFAMGSSTESSACGPTHNPWSLDRTPGGSSGGSAAAVAADECLASLGSDTGGSIRQPASFCGCVGLKPTYGRLSRYGLVAFASSLDQIGPLTKSVEDSARLLQVLAGWDPADSTSMDQPVPDYLSGLKDGVKGLRIGLPEEYFVGGLDPEVSAAVQASIRQFESLGAELVPVRLPHTEYAVATYYVLATAEASANLARFDGVRYCQRVDGADPAEMYARTRGAGFGDEVKRRIILGTYVLSSGYYDAYYIRAQKVRTLIQQDFLKAYESVDLILTPTATSAAFKLGEKLDDPLQMYLSDVFTLSCNLAGNCGISVPCGLTESGLPIGLQLLGKPFEEEVLLRAAFAFEQSTDWHKARPSLA